MKIILTSREGLKLLDYTDNRWKQIDSTESFWAGGCCAHDGFVFSGRTVPDYPAGCVGTVRSYRLTDLARSISEQIVPGGRPATVSVAPNDRALLTAGYFGGCVCVFPFDDEGALSPPRQVIHHTGRGVQTPRQQAAHPHDIQVSPDGSSVLVPDLGTDSTWVYRYQEGELQPAEPAQAPAWPETGPRHVCWRPDSRIAWVLGELNGLIHIIAHKPETGWTTTIGHASCLAPGYSGPVGAATLALHPSGKWLYASLRAPETIVRFRVEDDGRLSDPRHTHNMVMAMAMHCHPDGEQLLVSHSRDNRLCSCALDAEGLIGSCVSEYPVQGPGAFTLIDGHFPG